MVRAQFLGSVLLGTRGVLGQQAENCPRSMRHRQAGTSPSPYACARRERDEWYPEVKGEAVSVASIDESTQVTSWRSFADLTCTCRDGFVGDGYWCSGKLPDVLADDARFSTFYSVSNALLVLWYTSSRQ